MDELKKIFDKFGMDFDDDKKDKNITFRLEFPYMISTFHIWKKYWKKTRASILLP